MEELMNYRKHGLKALGLSLFAVLGLLAFAATAAQASGLVLVLKADQVGSLPKPFTVGITGKEHNALAADSRLLILTLNFEIFCHKLTVSNGLLTSSGSGSATITFEICLVQGVTGADVLTGAVCQIDNIVAKTKFLIILHSGNVALVQDNAVLVAGAAEHKKGTGNATNPYILFLPLDLLTFASVLNHSECALPEIANVKGCVVAKVNTTGHQVEHLISTKGLLSLFGCNLHYGANLAHLDVDAFVSLTNSVHGNHQGLLWKVE